MSKRVKITFETVNKDKYTIIDPMLIAKSNKRIKEEMHKFIKKLIKK